MRNMCTAVVGLLAGLGGAVAHGHGFDVAPAVSNGQIFTNGFVDETSEFILNVRVFGLEFGEDPLDPYFLQDPGFHPQPGSGFPQDSAVGFQVLDGLKFWDGLSNVNFVAPSAGETLRLQKGLLSILVGTLIPDPAGFGIESVPASGEFDEHLESILLSPTTPSAGIYLLSMRITSSDPSIDPSAPIWFVYNNGLSEDAHDAAISFVNTSIIPEPSGLAAVLLATGILTRRRK